MATKTRRRRRRRNAAPGKLPVGVKSYSRKSPKRRKRRAKAKSNPGSRKRRRRAKSTGSTRRRRRSSRSSTKRRRRRSARKNSGSRRRRRRARSNGGKRRRRRARRNGGVRRRRRSSRRNKGTRRRRARRNGGRRVRRRARRNGGMDFAPVKRRRSRARRNGGKRRRARRNPGGFRVGSAVGTVKSELKKLLRPQSWLPAAAHGALGVGFAHKGPDFLARYTAQFGLMNVGYGGVALSALSTALGAGLTQVVAGMIPGKKGLLGSLLSGIGRNVFVGGAIWTAIRLVQELLPTSSMALQLPNARGGMAGMYGMGGLGAYGAYPGQYPSYAPLGVVTSPEELIAGESLARQIGNEGGMGQPIPIQDFRGTGDWMELSGMRGLGNWVEFQPDTGIAMEQFAPGVEAF